jgi:Protein of unknown function (DUF2909)
VEPLKTLILLLLGAIVVSLGKAMFHLTSGPDESGRMVRALTVRITLSIALFALLMLVWYFGGISPHPLS